MNKVTILDIQPYYECLNFIIRYYNGNESLGRGTYEELMTSLLQKHLFDEKTLKRKLKCAAALQKKIIEAVQLSQEDIAYYFTVLNEECTIADILRYAYFDLTKPGTALKDNAYALYDTYGNTLFQMGVCSDESNMDSEEVFADGFSFLTYLLQHQDISDDIRWRFLEINEDVKAHLDHLFHVLEPGVQVLLQMDDKAKQILMDFHSYLEVKCKEATKQGVAIDANIFVDDFVCSSTIDDKKQVVIVPTIATLNGIGRSERRLFHPSTMVIEIGILLDDSYHVENHLSDQLEINQVLRYLGDPSKYEILKVLKHNVMYGAQIGEHLGLSKATISHHMNALTASNLLKVRIDKKRIYYGLNEEYIRSFLQRVEEELLNS